MSHNVATSTVDYRMVVKFAGYTGSLAPLADAIEKSLVDHIANEGVATVQAYFVRARHDDIEVGLRFSGIELHYLEDTAKDLITAAIEDASMAEHAPRHRRVSTSLVGV